MVSAVAELSPDRQNFYITFTVDEGPHLHISAMSRSIPRSRNWATEELRPLVPIKDGDIYDADLMQKSIDALTNAAGTKGYAFAEVHPRITPRPRQAAPSTWSSTSMQGPRVYIEKINIVGNTRTLDKVIRREFRLVEGDAFNRVLVDRSRTRIRGLGFFKDVDIKHTAGHPARPHRPQGGGDRTIDRLALAGRWAIRRQARWSGEFSYTERNLFGRASSCKRRDHASQISKELPAQLHRALFPGPAAGGRRAALQGRHQLSAGRPIRATPPAAPLR